METALLIAIGAAVFWFATRGQTAAPGLVTTTTTQGSQPQTTGTSAIVPLSPVVSPVSQTPLSAIPVVGGAIQSGLNAGKAIDAAVNPNANATSQTIASVLGAVAETALVIGGILAAIPVIGWVALAVALAVVVVAAVIYAFVVFIDDIHALQYGQAGARRDFLKQYNGMLATVRSNIQSDPRYQNASQPQVDRFAVPFVEGYLAALNFAAYRSHMQHDNFVVDADVDALLPSSAIGTAPNIFPGIAAVGGTLYGSSLPMTADSHFSAVWGYDRGKYVGADFADGVRPVDNVDGWTSPNGVAGGRLSTNQTWILQTCPQSDLQLTSLTDIYTRAQGATIAAAVTAAYAANGIGIVPYFMGNVPVFVAYGLGQDPTKVLGSDATVTGAIANYLSNHVSPQAGAVFTLEIPLI